MRHQTRAVLVVVKGIRNNCESICVLECVECALKSKLRYPRCLALWEIVDGEGVRTEHAFELLVRRLPKESFHLKESADRMLAVEVQLSFLVDGVDVLR